MKLLRKLLLIVPFLYGITVSGTTWGLEPDKNYIIHEVAHPRACVLIDNEGKRRAPLKILHTVMGLTSFL